MVHDNESQESASDDTILTESRRNVLKLTGAGASVAALGGMSLVGAGQDDGDNGGENETGENETGDGGDEEMVSDAVFVDDLIDPTFGYPLAADETGSVEIDTVVEADQLQGEAGAHDGFPQQPGPEGGEFPLEFVFDPVGVQVAPDDVVHFLSVVGEHTVTAFDEKYANPELSVPTRIPEETTAFTSPPIVDGESWLYQFTTSGVYDILCLPHYFFGMVMRVVVFDPETDDIEDEQFSVEPPEEVPPNVQTVLSAEELDPANIVEQGSVAWADLTLDADTETPAETPTETPAENGTDTATPGENGTETGTMTQTEVGGPPAENEAGESTETDTQESY